MSEELRILLMGYLDDELDSEERARVEAALEKDPELARELREMRGLKELTDGLGVDERTDSELEHYWGGVYNKMERHTAWALLSAGFLMVIVVAAWLFFASPTTPPLIKVGVALAGVGALFLLWSVWRERCRVLPHDRYTNEVRR